jgi:hypothetical protein
MSEKSLIREVTNSPETKYPRIFQITLKNARRKAEVECLSACLDSVQRELYFKKYSIFSDWHRQQAQLEFDSRVKEPIPPIRVGYNNTSNVNYTIT